MHASFSVFMQSLLELFHRGGPIMWPLLLLSLAAVTIVLERLIFVLADLRQKDAPTLRAVLRQVEHGEWEAALHTARPSRDAIVQVMAEGIAERHHALSAAMQRAAEQLLQRHARGLALMDTCITAAPLLGLLGTVTGMIRAFSLIGGSELGAPTAITGGIAEALIATCFGLGIALLALFPFNFLQARLEAFRHQLQDACTAVEIAARKGEESRGFP